MNINLNNQEPNDEENSPAPYHPFSGLILNTSISAPFALNTGSSMAVPISQSPFSAFTSPVTTLSTPIGYNEVYSPSSVFMTTPTRNQPFYASLRPTYEGLLDPNTLTYFI